MHVRLLVALGAVSLATAVFGSATPAVADDVSVARIATFGASFTASDLLSATPQLECVILATAPGVCQYHLLGTPKAWAGRPANPIGGTLSNGQQVFAVPLQSAGNGRGHVFLALLWTRINARLRFVGYVPALNGGDLSVGIGNGALVVATSVYGPSDADCCPRHFRIERDTLDGIHLRKISATTVPATVWPGRQFDVPAKL